MEKKEWLQKIKEADIAYYDNDKPIMSDEDYNSLRNQYIATYGSKDLDYIAGSVKKGFKSFKHSIPITSLSKIQHTEKEKLLTKLKQLSPCVIELKLDGLTIITEPDNSFVTRGHKGITGEILPNFPHKYIHENTSEYPIRGEAFLTQSDFLKINQDRIDKKLEPFANRRNAAAGILRNLEKSSYLDYIQYIVYDVIGYDKSEEEKFKYIKEHTSLTTLDFLSLENVPLKDQIKVIEDYYAKYKDGDVPIDGLVVKSNTDSSLAKFGSTSHHPLNAFAYKAEVEKQITILREIVWQVGRETITPVAIFDPVSLEETTVQQATISNYGIIKDLDLMLNDTIMVEKRNQIIPHITKVIQHNKNSVHIKKPTTCPTCGAKLLEVKLKNTKAVGHVDNLIELTCPNERCQGKLSKNIEFVFSKGCLNAKGLGLTTIIKLIQLGKVKCINDVFQLKVEDFLQVDGFAQKSAENTYNSIQNSRKNVPLEIFIPACGILNISFDLGKILAKKFKTYDNLLSILEKKDLRNFTRIDGIGEVYANKLISDVFIQSYKELYNYITPIDNTTKIKEKANSFVITGKLSQSRDYYKKILEDNGDKIVGSVSGSTYALITEDNTSQSSKAKKARELGVKVINEKQLLDYLQKGYL